MDELLALLNKLEAMDLPCREERVLNNAKDVELRDLAQTISDLATTHLIGPNGECLWDQHDILIQAGFDVFAGEKDRFGWLTGCIQTSKGLIMFA